MTLTSKGKEGSSYSRLRSNSSPSRHQQPQREKSINDSESRLETRLSNQCLYCTDKTTKARCLHISVPRQGLGTDHKWHQWLSVATLTLIFGFYGWSHFQFRWCHFSLLKFKLQFPMPAKTITAIGSSFLCPEPLPWTIRVKE